VDSIQTGVLYYVGQLKNHSRLGFTVLIVCSRYLALPYRRILLIQQARAQMGTGVLLNYWMVLVLKNFLEGIVLLLLR